MVQHISEKLEVNFEVANMLLYYVDDWENKKTNTIVRCAKKHLKKITG